MQPTNASIPAMEITHVKHHYFTHQGIKYSIFYQYIFIIIYYLIIDRYFAVK